MCSSERNDKIRRIGCRHIMRIKNPDEKEGLVDAATLASYYDVSVRTVLLWAEHSVIPVAVRVNRVIRFDPAEVEDALRKPTRSKEENMSRGGGAG